MSDIPWDEIDKGIRDRVALCERLGFEPTSSCDGHGKHFPWVSVNYAGLQDIEYKLREAGDEPFRISRIRFVGWKTDEASREDTLIEWGVSMGPVISRDIES